MSEDLKRSILCNKCAHDAYYHQAKCIWSVYSHTASCKCDAWEWRAKDQHIERKHLVVRQNVRVRNTKR